MSTSLATGILRLRLAASLRMTRISEFLISLGDPSASLQDDTHGMSAPLFETS